MDKDFVTADEIYKRAWLQRNKDLIEKWNLMKKSIQNKIEIASEEGEYETVIPVARLCRGRDYDFVDFVVKKLRKAGYEVISKEFSPMAAIRISWERGDFY